MRPIAVWLTILCMQVSAASRSQTITLTVRNAQISKVFKEIKKQSGYLFLYNNELLQTAKSVTIHAKETPLNEVLDKCFEGQPLTYDIVDKTIVVKPIQLNQKSLWKDIIVKGQVKDHNGAGIPGVVVKMKGSSKGVITDTDGRYVISAPENGTLVFSYIGFKNKEVQVDNRDQINIAMEESVSDLSELVVVGYSSKPQSQLSSSVSVISGEKLNDVTSNQLSSLLQGKAPGVIVSTMSGDPTEGSNLLIRGASSINASTAPLIVVDGNIGGTYNPTDIESVTILKDAAATGLYGSRAANGVMIITTKSGKSGKTKINVNSLAGVSNASFGKFKLMNSQQLYDYQKLFYNPDPSVLNTNTDWRDLAFRTGLTQNHTINASGGNERTQFYVSGNYYNEEGTLLVNDKTSYNFRTNISHKLNEKLKLSVLVNAIHTKDTYHTSSILGDSYLNLPYDAAFNADGTPRDGRDENWLGRDHNNFLQGILYNFSNARSLNLNGDLNLDYQISDNFTFSTYNRATIYNYKDQTYYDKRTQAGAANSGELYNNVSYNSRLLTSNRLKYNKRFGQHDFTVLGVVEAEKSYSDNANLSVKNLPAGRPVISTATEVINNPTGGIDRDGFNKGLVQVDYDYSNKYFAIASFVNEFSARFGENNSRANFYQLGASWLVSNENFMKKYGGVTFLKFRASYGTTGNADGIGSYASRGLYSLSQSASYAGLPGAYPSQKANPNLTWEKVKTTNFGLDLGLFNRIDLNVDVYDKTSSALLFFRPLAATSGYDGMYENVGSVRNRGLELNLNTKNFVREFKWETNFNIAFNKNKVLKLNEGKQDVSSGARLPIALDHDMNEWRLPIWAGVDPDNGKPLWEKIVFDADGNKFRTLTSNYASVNAADSRQFTGTSAAPKFTGGITNTVSYKGVSLSAFFNFVYGNQIYNNTRFYFDNDGVYESYNAMVLAKGWSRWEKPGDNATHPKPVLGGTESNQSSSRYLENGSYIRLRNVTLAYQLPVSWTEKINIVSLKIFASGDNIWTGTRFTGPDPEVLLSTDDRTNRPIGSSSFKYPLSRKFLFGLNVGF